MDDALANDAIIFLEHSRQHHYQPADIRVILRYGRIGYGNAGPESERYTAEASHPTLGPSRVVFGIQEPNVIVISAYEKW